MIKYKAIFENNSTVSKLIVLFAIFSVIALAITPISTLISWINPDNVNLMKIIQIFISVFLFILPPFIVAYLFSNKPFVYLNLTAKNNWSNVIIIVSIMILLIPFINLIMDWNRQLVLPGFLEGVEKTMKDLEEQAAKVTEQWLAVSSVKGLILNVIVIALIPALGEELFFRGALQRILQDWKGVVVAIWITAFLFSAIHLQFYGFFPRLLLGAFFGYLLYWSGSMKLAIIAHFTNNFLAVLFYYLKNNGYVTVDIDTLGVGSTVWLGYTCGVLSLVAIVLFKRKINREFSKRVSRI